MAWVPCKDWCREIGPDSPLLGTTRGKLQMSVTASPTGLRGYLRPVFPEFVKHIFARYDENVITAPVEMLSSIKG
jgi:hypothetical protein